MTDDACGRTPGSREARRSSNGRHPTLGADDVLVEVSYCGVCGSDIHMTLEGWGRPGSVGGHEWTGIVAAVGADVDATGTSATPSWVAPRVGAAQCGPCRAGRPSLCEDRDTPGADEEHGAFARYIRTHHAELLALPDGLGLREAALTEPLAVALHGITLSRIEPHEIGDGHRRRARSASWFWPRCVARGWTDVAVVEPAPTRAGSGPRARCRPGAASRRARRSVDRRARPHRRRRGRRRVRVLGPPGRHGGRSGPAPARRSPGDGRRRHRSAPLRPEPHPVERAVDHRIVHLRRRRLRPGPRRCSARGRCPSTSCSSRASAADAICSTPCNGSPPARSRPRCSCAPGGATMADQPRPPRFNHVAMSVPGDLLDETAPRRPARPSTARCSAGRRRPA